MKKILLFIAGALMLANTTVTAQTFTVANSGYGNQLATNFPEYCTLGNWTASYNDSSNTWDFDDATIIVAMQKNGLPVSAYSYLEDLQLTISYNTVLGTVYQPYYPTLAVLSGLVKEVIQDMPPISPIDKQMSISLSCTLKKGIDTVCDFIGGTCAVKGNSGTITSFYSGGLGTYIEKVVSIAPVAIPESTFATVPAYQKVVGAFELTFNDGITWDQQINLQASGSIMGYIPMLDNPVVVDSDGNFLTYPTSGTYGGVVGMAMRPGLYYAKGTKLKVYVLSNILSAMPGDFIQVSMVGICGHVDSFPAVAPGPIGFCDFSPSELDGRLTYDPPTAVSDVHATGDAAVYPNPAQDEFTVSAEGKWTCSVTDMTGKAVQTFSGIGAQKVQRGEIPSGMYILSLQTESGQKKVKIVFQ